MHFSPRKATQVLTILPLPGSLSCLSADPWGSVDAPLSGLRRRVPLRELMKRGKEEDFSYQCPPTILLAPPGFRSSHGNAMNLKHLETFHHFCRCMTMSGAAENMNVSQPAVSQQLRSFESECGVKLYYRQGNTYRLTEVGETIFLLCRRIFSRVDQIESQIDKARKRTTDTLRIGTTKAYARTVMPDLIALFQGKYPMAKVRLSEGNSADLLSRLRDRKEDLVVVARTKYPRLFRAIPFARADFLLVARPDHPLAVRGEVSLEELKGENLIIREHGSGTRDAILAKLHSCGITPSLVTESESLSFILAYIERRMGISFMLSHEIETELSGGLLKRIEVKEGEIGFYADIVRRRQDPVSIPMRHFLEIVRKRKPREKV